MSFNGGRSLCFKPKISAIGESQMHITEGVVSNWSTLV